jgi:predicted nucleic acid-binding protein
MALAVEQNEPANPCDVRLLGARAVVAGAQASLALGRASAAAWPAFRGLSGVRSDQGIMDTELRPWLTSFGRGSLALRLAWAVDSANAVPMSGVRGEQQYETLRRHLRAFPDIALEAEDYEDAASFFNRCRAKGVRGSNTDLLICAVAARRRFGILTTDTDFLHFAKVLPIELHFPRASVSG